jgi:carbonic anhydrase
MQRLLKGLEKFVTTVHSTELALYEQLAAGQNPNVYFVACADSRVQPTSITQAHPGQLFVSRNAGNIVPPQGVPGGEAATLQYAVEVLGVQHIVICGHSDCGAVKAVLNRPPASLSAINAWIDFSAAVVDLVNQSELQTEADRLRYAIECNVLIQLKNVQTYDFVQKAVSDGKLFLHGWVFDIPSGDVLGWHSSSHSFEPIFDTGRPLGNSVAHKEGIADEVIADTETKQGVS